MVDRLIQEYLDAIKLAEQKGSELADTICGTLKDVIPDIEWSLGWAEAGIDTICFWSRSHSLDSVGFLSDEIQDVLISVFPELKGNIDTPTGIYLNKREVGEVREKLQILKSK